MFDLSDIRQLRAIAKFGSVSKAAEFLHVSQPTLSKRLSRLEQLLGIVLFDRSPTGMVPTAPTRYILEAGCHVEFQLNTVSRHVELMANSAFGTLNIGVGPILEQLCFPHVLSEFYRRAPNVRVSLKTGDGSALLKWLHEGVIDIAVGGSFEENTALKEFHMEPLQGDSIVFVARPEHPLSERQQCLFGELLQYPTIGPSLPTLLAKQMDPGLQLHFTCDNYAIAKSMVVNSDFVSGGPERLFIEELAAGTLVKLPVVMEIHWAPNFIVRPESRHLPVVQHMLDIFLNVNK